MWRCEEIAVRKGDVGSQWSGRDPKMRCCKIEAMVYSMFSREREGGRHVYKARGPAAIDKGFIGESGERRSGRNAVQ